VKYLVLISPAGPIASKRTADVGELIAEGVLADARVAEFDTDPWAKEWPGISSVIVLTGRHAKGWGDFERRARRLVDVALVESRWVNVQGENAVADLVSQLEQITAVDADLVFIVREAAAGPTCDPSTIGLGTVQAQSDPEGALAADQHRRRDLRTIRPVVLRDPRYS
jgi:hypothetical protein